MVENVRERSREILRAELADAAASFCAERGFDAVTADVIAQAIGISRATFFRYFTSKEDAVVSAARGAADRAGAFAHRIAETADEAAAGTAVWAIVRTAAESMIDRADARGDALRARLRMITEVPALSAHMAAQQRRDQSAIADVVQERIGDARAARAIAAAAVSAVDLAWQEWARTPDSTLRPLLDTYFAALGDVGTLRLT